MLKHNNMKIKHEIVEMLRTFTCSWTLSSLDVVVPRGLLHNPRTASISDRNARSGSCLSMCVWHLVMVLVWWVPYSEVLSQWAELQPKQQRPGATLMHFILVRPQGMICMMWSGEGRGGGGGRGRRGAIPVFSPPSLVQSFLQFPYPTCSSTRARQISCHQTDRISTCFLCSR